MISKNTSPKDETRMLARIRARLGRDELDDRARERLEARLKTPKANLIPAVAQGTTLELRARFVERALKSSASVDEIANLQDIPQAVAQFLSRNNLPPEFVMAQAPAFLSLPWEKTAFLNRLKPPIALEAAVSLTPSFAGVAETGTLMLCSGSQTPTTLNFLAETHIVVLAAKDIVGSLEEALARLRAQCPGGGPSWPRNINLITGPSRTADIEQTMYMGAHGPRRLHIILVD